MTQGMLLGNLCQKKLKSIAMSYFVMFLLHLVNLEYYNAIAMLEINLNVHKQM